MQTAAGLQELVWAFICTYKQHSGRKISYIAIAEDPELLASYLDHARTLPSPELRDLAERIAGRLASGQARATKTSGRPLPALFEQGGNRDGRAAWITREYQELLQAAYERGSIGLSSRLELDAFRRRHRLNPQHALELENAVRAERDLPPVVWQDELRQSIRDLQTAGRLTERDRLQLFDTYLSKGRLSISQAEEILSEELPPAATPSALPRRPLWPVAASLMVGALVALTSLGPLGRVLGLREAVADARPGPAEIRVSGSILEAATWGADAIYRLDGVVFVEPGATLTIEPGTRIVGGYGSALVVTRGATIHARGTSLEPIVFTSARGVGQRQPGDWGGLVLLGSAPVNRAEAAIEGIDGNDRRGRFGGGDPSSSCGVLEYVRIEFAGHEVFANNELNGLTLGGCGDTTIVRNVQVHRALDDGIEVFGGTVDLKNILVTGARDDSLDWDMGWTGRVQFMVLQQHADSGDNAIEADNAERPDALPRSAPQLYNVTLIGSRNFERAQRAMTLRRGTGGVFRNLVIDGFPLTSIDIRDGATAERARNGELSFRHTLLHAVGRDGRTYFEQETGDADDDAGFDEAEFFAAATSETALGIDPMLPTAAFDPLKPKFVPDPASPVAAAYSPIPQQEFFDQSATYLGAIRPGVVISWPDGWADYPAN